MSILRLLILKEWFKLFFGASFVLMLLVTIANLISGFLRGSVTPTEVILNHLIETPGYLAQVFPVASLVASLFSINKLKSHSELTAIFASGFSRKRFFSTIFLAATIIAALQFTTLGFVRPFVKSYKKNLLKDKIDWFKNQKSQGLLASAIISGKFWFKSDQYFFSFSKLDLDRNTIQDVTLLHYNQDHVLFNILKAKEIKYLKNDQWSARDGYEISHLSGEGFPKEKPFDTKLITLAQSLKDLKEIQSDITTLNIFRLYSYIQKLKQNGLNTHEYLVLYLNIISSSITCIVFALLAAISAFTPNRRNSSFGKSVFMVFIFTLSYWLIASYFFEMGKNSKINPYLACFIVPLFFSIIFAGFSFKNRKL